MLTCPMCKKAVEEVARQCPRCATDLTLLTDYVAHRRDGLDRAEALTRQGELADAVWAYLEVLEVDPDNAEARRQVGQVVTAVRQFDRAAFVKRNLDRLRRQVWVRRWLDAWQPGDHPLLWLGALFILLVLAGCLLLGLGYYAGYQAGQNQEAPPVSIENSPT